MDSINHYRRLQQTVIIVVEKRSYCLAEDRVWKRTENQQDRHPSNRYHSRLKIYLLPPQHVEERLEMDFVEGPAWDIGKIGTKKNGNQRVLGHTDEEAIYA